MIPKHIFRVYLLISDFVVESLNHFTNLNSRKSILQQDSQKPY